MNPAGANARFYEVPIYRVPDFERAVKKLIERAGALGVGAQPSVTIGEKVWKPDANGTQVEYLKVILHDFYLKLGEWELIAKVEALPGGNLINVNQWLDEQPLAIYAMVEPLREKPIRCDHCNIARARKSTYIFRVKATGEMKQVGSDCARLFFGVDGLDLVKYHADLVGLSEFEADTDLSGGQRLFDVGYLLQIGASMIRRFGFVSSKQSENPTGRQVLNAVLEGRRDPNLFQRLIAEVTEADRDTAIQVLEWVSQIPSNATEYHGNLRAAISSGFVSPRHIPLVVSGIVAMQMSRQRSSEGAFDYLAPVGSKISEKKATKKDRDAGVQIIAPISAVVEIKRRISTQYGPSTMIIARSDTQPPAKLVWFSSGEDDASIHEGVAIVIKQGTVKELKERDGVKQTTLTRVWAVLTSPTATFSGPKEPPPAIVIPPGVLSETQEILAAQTRAESAGWDWRQEARGARKGRDGITTLPSSIVLSALYYGMGRWLRKWAELNRFRFTAEPIGLLVLKGLDLEGVALGGIPLIGLNAENCNFKGAIIPEGMMDRANLVNCNFELANMRAPSIKYARLEDCNFKGAFIGRAQAKDATFDGCDFREAYCPYGEFSHATFRGCNLEGADFKGSDLTNARLYKSSLGTNAENGTNFSDADLTGAIVRGDSSFANLTGATMGGPK